MNDYIKKQEIMDHDTKEELNNAFKPMVNAANLYHAIGKVDRHIIDILHWIANLEKLKNAVRETDQDKELEKELHDIINRLISRVGFMINMNVNAAPDI